MCELQKQSCDSVTGRDRHDRLPLTLFHKGRHALAVAPLAFAWLGAVTRYIPGKAAALQICAKMQRSADQASTMSHERWLHWWLFLASTSAPGA